MFGFYDVPSLPELSATIETLLSDEPKVIGVFTVRDALQNFFEPREINVFRGNNVPIGVKWSVICEPHSHWRVRVALKSDDSLCVSVSHPGEGSTLERVFPAGFNFGEILGLIGKAVPVKEEV